MLSSPMAPGESVSLFPPSLPPKEDLPPGQTNAVSALDHDDLTLRW